MIADQKLLIALWFVPIVRKPDIHVPYLYVDMGAAVLCASFMSFGVKRRWFAMAAAVQLAVSTYASYIGEQVYYGDWLKVSQTSFQYYTMFLTSADSSFYVSP